MSKQTVKPFRPICPTPAALVTSVGPDGRANIITLGEVFNLSIADPVIVGIAIAKPRYSHQLIAQAGEFVVNLPTSKLLHQVDRCGTLSGRKVDKFAATGLTPVPAQRVKAPLIAECPLNLECRLLSVEEVGDHDLFKGEVLVQHVDQELLDERGHIRVEKLDVLCYVLGQYWSLGGYLNYHGYSAR